MKLPLINLPGKIPSGQIVYFTRQLSIMLKAGIPLIRALHTLSSQLTNKELACIVRSIAMQVEQGDKLSEALARYPKVFPSYYVNMVKVAEIGGALDEIFRRLASFLEKQERLKKKIISALVYPMFILLVAVAILIIIMAFVVPAFMKMFKEYGESLPAPTQFLLSLSSIVRVYWWLFPILVLGMFLLLKLLRKVDKIRYQLDLLLLKTPLIGGLLKRFYVSRFSQTLGTLLSSGVPIVEGLQVVKGTLGNEVFRSIIQRLMFVVQEGEDISSYLRSRTDVFPPLVVEMVKIGEETGSLPSMLNEIAEVYEDEMDLVISSFTSILEPFLIVFMGLVVGFVVIAMFLPLFTLTQAMSQ